MKEISNAELLQLELEGICSQLAALANVLNHQEYDQLTDDAMASALYGIEHHIERIAEDVAQIDVDMDLVVGAWTNRVLSDMTAQSKKEFTAAEIDALTRRLHLTREQRDLLIATDKTGKEIIRNE